MKLYEIADLQTGLVLNRKQDKNGTPYRVLSNKHINQYREITGYEDFVGSGINSSFLTQKNDIVFKIAAPNNSILISSDQDTGVLVSSSFFIIRCKNSDFYLPEFLYIYFNSYMFKEFLKQMQVGTTVRAMSLSTLRDIELPNLTITKQKEIIEFVRLATEEKRRLQKLIALKEEYHETLLTDMIEGKNGQE